MVRLRVSEILTEKGLSRYWLCKRLGMHYVSFKKMIENNTDSIRFDTIDRLAKILDVQISDLLIQLPDENPKTSDQSGFDLSDRPSILTDKKDVP